jgi:hypothetical protein
MLFDKIRKTRQPEPADVEKIFDRLQSMRDQISQHEVPVSHLFGEGTQNQPRPRWPLPLGGDDREPERVRPQDVPTVKNYVAWE